MANRTFARQRTYIIFFKNDAATRASCVSPYNSYISTSSANRIIDEFDVVGSSANICNNRVDLRGKWITFSISTISDFAVNRQRLIQQVAADRAGLRYSRRRRLLNVAGTCTSAATTNLLLLNRVTNAVDAFTATKVSLWRMSFVRHCVHALFTYFDVDIRC